MVCVTVWGKNPPDGGMACAKAHGGHSPEQRKSREVSVPGTELATGRGWGMTGCPAHVGPSRTLQGLCLPLMDE